MFEQLYGTDVREDDRGLLVFLAVPNVKEIYNFVWDTDVPEVTRPWPQYDYEPISLKEHLKLLTRAQDTGVLYERTQLLELLEVSGGQG